MSGVRRRGIVEAPPMSRLVGGGMYVAVMAVLAGVAAWPIYATPDFVVLAIVAPLLGGAIAVASLLRSWRLWLTAVVTAGVLVVAGVALAVPARRGEVLQWPQSALEVLTGMITGFKDLLTVELPVGAYRNLLVPALVVLLVGTLVALRLAWAGVYPALGGALVALGMTFFGLAFGSAGTSDPLTLGPVTIAAPREALVGALALIASLLWLCRLALDERRRALRRAAVTTGVRVSRRRTGSDSRRVLLAGGMVVVALGLAGVAAPALAGGQSRDVLRSAAGPALDLSQRVSPLAEYRGWFADDRYDDILFSVTAEGGPLPDRIRIATLTSYDGTVFRPLDDGDDARYLRVPSRLDAGPGTRATARLAIEGLDDIWLPTFGRVEQIDFTGPQAARLADGFYYSEDGAAGVEATGLAEGDEYTVTGVIPDTPALAEIEAPGVPESAIAAPESLVAWMNEQDAGTGGAALAELTKRLRERGYLSHALRIDPDAPPAWVAELDAYSFQPSAAGHSLARIDALFRLLLDRENAVGDADGTLVAAIGDDEQFSVAVALLAQQLGFPARVVLGTRLTPAEGVSACVDGVCRAGDMTAWTEVQSSAGEWVAVDVTPQHSENVDTETLRQRDPENPTEVRPESADEVVPPNPVQQDSPPDEPGADDGIDLAGLWAVLRIAAISLLALLIVIGPLAVVIVAKALRRTSRRRAARAAVRVVGGWEEYVDAAVDHGLAPPAAHTRAELAELHARPAAAQLAAAADRAVFSGTVVTEDDAATFWRIVDDERRRLASERSLWQRARAAVSLKSFTRVLSPRTGTHSASARRSERRMRRIGDVTST